MITEYEIIPIEHPLIHEALFWHEELWLNQTQIACLFPKKQASIKRYIRIITQDQPMANMHHHMFSVVKQRRKANGDMQSDWIYQIHYYDKWYITELLKKTKSEEANAFLHIATTTKG